ncbi:MAG: anti-sigma factor [Leptolyngbyaceae cyanobacterium bins.59]|nr:anti-sigma factor [Leptolyngbyaceae cyanobacterium bins.59]
MSMRSEELQLMMAGYVLGELSQEEAAAFEQALVADPTIAEEVAQLQAALEQSYGSPEITPPEPLRAQILEAAQGRQEPVADASPRRSSKHWPVRLMLEGIAAALIVALGMNNYRLWQALERSEVSAHNATLAYLLGSTQAGSQASARVLIDPDTLTGTIVVQNLPPLPPGKTYALWTVVASNAPFTTDDKKAILTEVFQVDERGYRTQTIAVPKVYRSSELVTKVAITIEDAQAPQAHKGSPVLIADL